MSVIDDILWLLKDGTWHDMEEIIKNIELEKTKAKVAIDFLREYRFVQVNKSNGKVKLQPSTFEFIKQIQCLEKETLSH